MPELQLPEPIPIQLEMLEHPARYKLLPWGRRASKTRLLWLASLTGHGPGWPEKPLHPGVLHGGDVVWLARDHTQGGVLWEEEIEARLRAIPGIQLNKQERTANFRAYGGGTLHMKSFENIDSVRGLGSRLRGVVTDEGAHFDLKTSWNRVLRPMLVDNRGWGMFGSTTNAGHDGNPEGIAPSFFNRLCTQWETKELDDEWFMTRRTARDNPRLPQDEVEKWINSYPPNSLELQEEVLALCVEGGGGLLFPYLREDTHWLDLGGFLLPGHRGVVAADWGWTSPAATGWICTDSGVDAAPRSHVYREWWPTETLPQDWAEEVCAISSDDGIEMCLIDGAVEAPGQDGSPSIYEQMVPVFRRYKMRLYPVPKGPKSIIHSTQTLHQYLYTGDGRAPILTIDRACPKLWAELTRLRRGNPIERVTENPNIPAPHQQDHGFDMIRYWAMSRPQPAAVSEAVKLARDPATPMRVDPATATEIDRNRAAEAIRQGKLPPPPRAPKPVPQRKSPWTR